MGRKTFDRSDVIKSLSEKLNIPKTTAKKVHDAFIESLKDGLHTGKPVVLGDMGRLYLVRHKAAKRCFNVQTKEIQVVEPKIHARISISERFREVASKWGVY